MNEPGSATAGESSIEDELLDPDCLQCGQARSAVRRNNYFCCTISGYETPEVDQEWERHRWADWTDRELDRQGVKPAAYDKHRRTDAGVFAWIDCDDTKRGHLPADDETAAGWGIPVGNCCMCGKVIVPSVFHEANPILHLPGCSWETTPYCDCGADPERALPPAARVASPTEGDVWACSICALSAPHTHGPDTDVMSSSTS